MSRTIHDLLGMPLFTGAAVFAIALVGGLLLSDWAEKRRNRRLMEVRARLRELNQFGAAGQVPGGAPAVAGTSAWQTLVRGKIRWIFVLLAVIAGVVAGWTRRSDVAARELPAAPAPISVVKYTNLPEGISPIADFRIVFGLQPAAFRKASEEAASLWQSPSSGDSYMAVAGVDSDEGGEAAGLPLQPQLWQEVGRNEPMKIDVPMPPKR